MLGLVSGFIAGQEWIIIIVLAAVLIFGAKKDTRACKKHLVKQKANLRKARSKATMS